MRGGIITLITSLAILFVSLKASASSDIHSFFEKVEGVWKGKGTVVYNRDTNTQKSEQETWEHQHYKTKAEIHFSDENWFFVGKRTFKEDDNYDFFQIQLEVKDEGLLVHDFSPADPVPIVIVTDNQLIYQFEYRHPGTWKKIRHRVQFDLTEAGNLTFFRTIWVNDIKAEQELRDLIFERGYSQ